MFGTIIKERKKISKGSMIRWQMVVITFLQEGKEEGNAMDKKRYGGPYYYYFFF